MILGITGGVGTGKSTVLAYLKNRYGAYVIQLDEVARQLQQPGEVCYEPMREMLEQSIWTEGDAADETNSLLKDASADIEAAGSGHSIKEDRIRDRFALTDEDGNFNRSAIADIVFQNPELRKALNAIIHPAVKRRVLELIASCTDSRMNGSGRTASGSGPHTDMAFIVIEAALLLEDHYDEICDEIWYVYAEESVRRERLRKSRGYTDEKITDMFLSQRSEESFRRECALTIDNSSENRENTYRQLDEALQKRGIFPGDESHLQG